MRPRALSEDAALRIPAASEEQTPHGISSAEFANVAGVSWSTGKRVLDPLVAKGRGQQAGQSRATRYQIPALTPPIASEPASEGAAAATATPAWSGSALSLMTLLGRPLGVCTDVPYPRKFGGDCV